MRPVWPPAVWLPAVWAILGSRCCSLQATFGNSLQRKMMVVDRFQIMPHGKSKYVAQVTADMIKEAIEDEVLLEDRSRTIKALAEQLNSGLYNVPSVKGHEALPDDAKFSFTVTNGTKAGKPAFTVVVEAPTDHAANREAFAAVSCLMDLEATWHTIVNKKVGLEPLSDDFDTALWTSVHVKPE